ncbi:MAG: hypothetical protein KKH94_10135 [Candidatus Omnitrophica bacterium]|nr:hypothetical protein [Candidatus Omnitrophota bacterium]
MRKILQMIIAAIVMASVVSDLEAGQVTMAAYDFDGDYIDEIVRTDEQEAGTIIKIYKRIENSIFYKPLKTIEVPGKLVQVPEIADINGDGMKEYFYATGMDTGIIYYDVISETFLTTNDFNFDAAVLETQKNEDAYLLDEDDADAQLKMDSKLNNSEDIL